uniref:NADH-ubiquinone oxidoreductase chain 5 n=4 Tax=Ruditapes philippinarum TaxID=129788 RepID=Q7YF39_RUDPH|nr:NADH dehydrogenase subunit 5 [Ruditapes philippinarum]
MSPCCNAALSKFFFFFLFFYLAVVAGVFNGGALVLEWELSEKLFVETSFCLVLDWISCLFSMSVLYISGCVCVFSGFYLSHDKFLEKFFVLLKLFVVSMVVLVLFPSYLGLMVGWDGLGVISFLLVIYYLSSCSLSSGMITVLSNRVGDVCFILAISLMSSSLSFGMWGESFVSGFVLGIFLMMGSMTKSAQVPFSAWLPEAMSAPTPVSSLVHSSTLVTAGVYVLIRFSAYLSEFEMYMLSISSMVTMLLAGSSACMESDLKKVVALSTLSQVGMMMFAISLGANVIAFFHLLVHAFFKALMFMCMGGVIYYSGSCQDSRFLGGVWNKLPFTSCLFLFSNFSLMGFPFFSGFYSKELIVGAALSLNVGLMAVVLFFMCLAFTISYSFRTLNLVMQDMSVFSLKFYSMENGYYLSSLLLMMNGAISTSLIMQSILKEFSTVSFVNPSVFYSVLLLLVMFLFNLVLLFNCLSKKSFMSLTKNFFKSMWFLSIISGNFISSKLLMMISSYIVYVEMGWIRAFIGSKVINSISMAFRNKIWEMNMNFFGVILFVFLSVFLILKVF